MTIYKTLQPKDNIYSQCDKTEKADSQALIAVWVKQC